MITSGIRHIIQLFCILLLLNIIFAAYETPRAYRRPYVTNNQRSADSGYKFAWFTRDIHDDMKNDEGTNHQDQPFSPQQLVRMKTLKSIFNRKYPNNDETPLESNEKR